MSTPNLHRRGPGAAVAVAVLTTLVGVAAAPRPAAAQPPAGAQPADYPPCTKKASPADLDAAKGAHKAATEFNERGDYDKAIQYWRDAYGFDCSAHALLINIANAYEKKGDKPSAIVALETYQARTGGTNTTIGEKITKLKASLAPQPPPPPTTTAPPPPPPPPTSTAAPPPPPPPSGERPYGVAPWIVVGGGGAALLVGAILLPVGFSGISSAEASCPTRTNCTSDVTSQGNGGRTEVGVGFVLAGVGVAAVGAGLAWQLLGNQRAAGGAAKDHGLGVGGLSVEPAVGPQQRGLQLSGSF
ncbi:MAG TPA: hypothetical protein VGM56_33850 [Byssovorax sp.]|jgi:hypothetical protein